MTESAATTPRDEPTRDEPGIVVLQLVCYRCKQNLLPLAAKKIKDDFYLDTENFRAYDVSATLFQCPTCRWSMVALMPQGKNALPREFVKMLDRGDVVAKRVEKKEGQK